MGLAQGHFLGHTPPLGLVFVPGGQGFAPGVLSWAFPGTGLCPRVVGALRGGLYAAWGGRDWCKNLCKSGLVLILGL